MTVRILGAAIDRYQTFDNHITNTVMQSYNCHCRSLLHIRQLIDKDAATTLACWIVSSASPIYEEDYNSRSFFSCGRPNTLEQSSDPPIAVKKSTSLCQFRRLLKWNLFSHDTRCLCIPLSLQPMNCGAVYRCDIDWLVNHYQHGLFPRLRFNLLFVGIVLVRKLNTYLLNSYLHW